MRDGRKLWEPHDSQAENLCGVAFLKRHKKIIVNDGSRFKGVARVFEITVLWGWPCVCCPFTTPSPKFKKGFKNIGLDSSHFQRLDCRISTTYLSGVVLPQSIQVLNHFPASVTVMAVAVGDFPLLCEGCLGRNPYIKMQRTTLGGTCKMCTKGFELFKWRPGQGESYKKTEVSGE